MIGWLRRRLESRPLCLALRTDGLVVVIGWQSGWLSGEVRMAPDDARILARCLVVMADDADAAMAEAIR